MASAFKLKLVSASETKPATVELRPEQLPASLRAEARWVGWHWLWRVDKAGKGKWTKPPLRPDGHGHAKSTAPETWGTFEQTCALMGRGDADGVGFVLGDGWCGADFDDCRDPDSGHLRPDIARYVAGLESYTEISATGTGVKVVGRGTKPKGFCRRGDIEVYDRGRYFALTGWRLGNSPKEVVDITTGLTSLYEQLTAPRQSVFRLKAERDHERLTDEQVLEKARGATNGDKFTRLWAGDTAGYAQEGNDGRSEADLALCGMLAFWCAKDYGQIDRLFRRSGLMRPKWDERHRQDGASYGRMTIEKSLEGGESYTANRPAAAVVTPDPDAEWTAIFSGEIIAEGTPKTFAELRRSIGGSKKRTFEILTIGELLTKEFPPPAWCIPGLLAEGLNLLVGSPKMGKSFLSLNLAMTVAAGGHALGNIRTVPGDVLYLSLEDQQRRVRARAAEMTKAVGRGADRQMSVATEWPRMDQGGLGLIEKWIQHVQAPRLVIIDVLGRFRPMLRDKGNAYEQDSQHMYAIKELADEHKVTILVVHHTRKAKGKRDDADDEMETISGTQGLAGGADGIILLHRMRHSNSATISVTGRDAPEHKLAIEFHKETLTWSSLGSAEELLKGKLQNAVLDYMKEFKGKAVFTNEIAEHINSMEPRTVETSPTEVRVTLHRLKEKGYVQKRGRAWMYPVESDDVLVM